MEFSALFDTGAKSTFISEELAKELGFRPYPKPIEIPLTIKGKTGEMVVSQPWRSPSQDARYHSDTL